MPAAPRNVMSMPGIASFTEELCVGSLRWDLVHPFPTQDHRDRAVGDTVVKDALAFLTEHVDPTLVDATSELPADLVDGLRSRGLLDLTVEEDLGGLGLSPYNAFRVVEAAASWSMAIGLLLATQNGIGAGAFAGALPAGPLRDYVRGRVADGVVSGVADTEPSGQANARRQTTATPTEDGTAYLLSGEKIHISNAPIADLLAVTATVTEADSTQTRLFFTDTSAPGFRVEAGHEFMGVKGFPNGRLVLDGVRVPRDRMLVEEAPGRHTPELTFLLMKGRLHIVVAPSLAIAKRGVRWAREFALRRRIDGCGLGEYEAVRRNIADSVADVFALESVAEWVMLADHASGRINPRLEQLAAKNIASIACWRVVERTMSLLAAEGFETARSKAARGAAPIPLERAFRDARGLRIWGGVDFLLDNWFAQLVIFSYHYPDRAGPGASVAAGIDAAGLSGRNRDHLLFVAEQARTFADACSRLARRYPEPEQLYTKQTTLITTSRILGELLTMSLVLARASRLADEEINDVQDVADVYCCAARHRLAGWWRRLSDDGQPDHAAVAARWLRGDPTEMFANDVVPHVPTGAAR